MVNVNKLSKAIDSLPYSIRPAQYFNFKKKLMNNATKTMPNGKSFYEDVYDSLNNSVDRNIYEPTEKELIDCTLITIYFLSLDIQYDIEFKVESTPLTVMCTYVITNVFSR